ncbi:DUF3732 domain-containing protein [Pseudomonas aeruginosa]|uniref:DUF3732 domain-containing protein n=1 Tax=Pseudomonas aeruginosa TaxID=287 RepID=A0A7L9E6R0_PSEAI|nr:DUF3732 domain-containing protein [Pseudomonas aeruginosa]MBM9950460.1 DUF3732 domain-containing protein [Pseudomonas aeruginosa]QOJ62931.1 DUF3732 domain-containing protein [Pseudomonas aeruginosa]QOJ63484.1 DUF3732 domain-containing protein [Pseudomonas aeruginosa]QOJ66763.1 DUF3732 domain-containing protein [Pseudomonas aeruginosa]
MTMQILQISVYGKNGERRDVKFKPSRVNIITGASKKGKSSLLDIVEYCLGSSECTVAEGFIRKTVDWYAILLQFSDTQVFIARAAPLPGQNSSSTSHMIVEKEIKTPNRAELKSSTNIDSVVNFLTEKLGVPEQQTEVPEGQTRSSISINFKHSRYYLFQSQDEIAAKKILFHRQSEPHIPQAIKDTIPYFLGAAEDDRLKDLAALRNLKQEKVRLNKKLYEIESLKGDGLQKGYLLLAEAANVGLYSGENLIPNEKELLSGLSRINNWTPPLNPVEDSDDNPLLALEQEYQRLQQQKREVRFKLNSANEFARSESGFEKEAGEQNFRLQSIGLFKKAATAQKTCPICESQHDASDSAEGIIKHAIADLAHKLDGVGRNRPRITGYIQGLITEQSDLADKIKKTRNSIDQIRSKNATSEGLQDGNLQKSRIAGRVSLYLDGINWADDTGPIKKQIAALEPQIEELEEKLNPEALKERLDAQISIISEDMTRWARELGLEHSEHPIRLDIPKLTVVAETPFGRTPLYRMGSGENWVGYHLVAYLALAKWFIKENRPVGRFIFFDQPTQVYFPSDKSVTGNIEEIESDEDRKAVKKMFEWLFKVVEEELGGDLQVIVTDHADIEDDWYQSAIADEKWRGDTALIPKHWYIEQ